MREIELTLSDNNKTFSNVFMNGEKPKMLVGEHDVMLVNADRSKAIVLRKHCTFTAGMTWQDENGKEFTLPLGTYPIDLLPMLIERCEQGRKEKEWLTEMKGER